jgi:tRNA-2-methylthio-N6-dimethylallyladenosine synthase
LQALLDTHQRKFNAACVDREVEVLFEKPGRLAGQLVGRSPYLQPVQATAPAEMIGTVARVRIVEAGSNSLFADLVTVPSGTRYPVLQAATGGA